MHGELSGAPLFRKGKARMNIMQPVRRLHPVKHEGLPVLTPVHGHKRDAAIGFIQRDQGEHGLLPRQGQKRLILQGQCGHMRVALTQLQRKVAERQLHDGFPPPQ